MPPAHFQEEKLLRKTPMPALRSLSIALVLAPVVLFASLGAVFLVSFLAATPFDGVCILLVLLSASYLLRSAGVLLFA